MKEILVRGLAELQLDTTRAEALEAFARAMLQKNEVMNLTRITEETAVAQLHLLDSAVLLTLADFKGKRVCDVGTGAGFPGMPLRILEDDFDLVLLDSLDKRIAWLREMCGSMGLRRVSCIHARAEEFAAVEKERFDIVTSRAVANLRMLSELCLPLVKVGGLFLAMKSIDSEGELREAENAIRKLGGTLKKTVDYMIPTSEVTHRLLIIEKTSPTPKGYPRVFAKIKKSPL